MVSYRALPGVSSFKKLQTLKKKAIYIFIKSSKDRIFFGLSETKGTFSSTLIVQLLSKWANMVKKWVWVDMRKGNFLLSRRPKNSVFWISMKIWLLFSIFDLIFWPFKFFCLMVSAFCDFGLPYQAPLFHYMLKRYRNIWILICFCIFLA